MELCFPQSLIPKAVLLGILSEAIDETPRDAKHFPQALWDAMGDLSVSPDTYTETHESLIRCKMSVQLQELLESPLLSEEGQNWLKEPREKQEDYLEWEDAQIFSLTASKDIDAYKGFLVPLNKTREKHILETVWKYINLVSSSHTTTSFAPLHVSYRIIKVPAARQLRTSGVLAISSIAPLLGMDITSLLPAILAKTTMMTGRQHSYHTAAMASRPQGKVAKSHLPSPLATTATADRCHLYKPSLTHPTT